MLDLFKELSHTFLNLVLKVTQGLEKIDLIFLRGRNQGWGTVRDPKELSGDLKVTEDIRIIQEIRKKREDSFRLKAGKRFCFQKGWRRASR